MGRSVHLRAIIHDFSRNKAGRLWHRYTQTGLSCSLFANCCKPKAELHLWHRFVKSDADRLIVSISIYGRHSTQTTFNGSTLKRWVSRSNFKSQIKSLFDLLTSLVWQLSVSKTIRRISNHMMIKSIKYFWYGCIPQRSCCAAGAGVMNAVGQILSVAIKQQ